ncbi:hypothetical protein [Kitasatospora sp. NPDC059571]|uniref:hypothetical protein n=1 Tax=Kitasatospora sp. NPDC059571 TaxID=3346871 RepID=UPI00368BCA7F
MKQATLKAASTAALGVAIAAAAAGSASAAAPGGLGLPTSALTNPGLTSAVPGAVQKVPGGNEVTQTVGTLNPAVGEKLTPAAPAAPADAPAADAPAADAAPAMAPAADRALPPVPGAQGLEKTPVGGVLGTVSGLGGATGGGLPGIGG